MVEAALAANGAYVVVPLQKCIDGATLLMMASGAATIQLLYDPVRAQAVIEIWNDFGAQIAAFLEALPLGLHKDAKR